MENRLLHTYHVSSEIFRHTNNILTTIFKFLGYSKKKIPKM